MPSALKCLVTVQAGIVPNEPIPEHTRSWQLSAEDIEAAQADPFNYKYLDALGAALNYAATMQNPNRVNWVRLNWTWV